MDGLDPQSLGDQTPEEYDPTAVNYSYEDHQAAAMADPMAGAADEDEEDEEEYDPEAPITVGSPSVAMRESGVDTPPVAGDEALKPQSADAAAAAAAPTPIKPPRTKGGFVDESEDDEEEDGLAAQSKAGSALLNAPGVSLSPKPKRSATLSPSNAQNQQHNVSSLSVQNEGVVPGVLPSARPVPDLAVSQPSTSIVSNAGTPAPDATKPAPLASAATHLPAAPSAQQSIASTPVNSSLPKARLPQDRVGMFEDRIAEDPRGDIEAWLGLIDEHRKRHKYVEARATYDEFFKVFPNAVRTTSHPLPLERADMHHKGRTMGRVCQHGDRT
jgi:cleavage stimulation factor subunit 3